MRRAKETTINSKASLIGKSVLADVKNRCPSGFQRLCCRTEIQGIRWYIY